MCYVFYRQLYKIKGSALSGPYPWQGAHRLTQAYYYWNAEHSAHDFTICVFALSPPLSYDN